MFKEKSKEFNIPKIDTPIIHGVTEIVLKNVKTGLVEKIVSENTFQSAVLAKQFPSNPWFAKYGMIIAALPIKAMPIAIA